jgi:hypothetical protein
MNLNLNSLCNCNNEPSSILHGCFGEDIPILLFNGLIKKSQDIKVGDILMGDDYTERIVEDVISGEDDLFEVNQVNGIKYTVNSKHILLLKNIIDDKSELVFEISTEQYMSLNNVYKSMLSGYKSIKIVNKTQIKNTMNLSKDLSVDKELFSGERSSKENTENNCNESVSSSIYSEVSTKEYTPITVNHIRKGIYYGYAISNNKQFLLSDFTVVHNCDTKYCKKCLCKIV